jgi:hypothetical protein
MRSSMTSCSRHVGCTCSHTCHTRCTCSVRWYTAHCASKRNTVEEGTCIMGVVHRAAVANVWCTRRPLTLLNIHRMMFITDDQCIIIIINPCKPYLTASAPRLTHWGGGK